MFTHNYLENLANKYKTPLYLYDLAALEQSYLSFKDAFKGRKSMICYALKANSNLHLVRTLASLGSGADCVSIFEVKLALMAGIPKYKIIFSGVGKSREDLIEAINLDIFFINVESFEEFKLIVEISRKIKRPVRISLRLNPNVDALTHNSISTGRSFDKFGLSLEMAKEIYKLADREKFILPIALHFHIGSQLLNIEPIKDALKIALEFLGSLNIKSIKFLDVGGGLGIKYMEEEIISLKDYGEIFKSVPKELTLIFEPGRRIIGESGFLLSSVLYEKRNEGHRFIILDAGMNDLIRPALYQAVHQISFYSPNFDEQLKGELTTNEEPAHIVGPICESADIFRTMNAPLNAKYVLIHDVGAYGYSMSSNYNLRGRCAEVGIRQNNDMLIRKREDLNDLMKNMQTT